MVEKIAGEKITIQEIGKITWHASMLMLMFLEFYGGAGVATVNMPLGAIMMLAFIPTVLLYAYINEATLADIRHSLIQRVKHLPHQLRRGLKRTWHVLKGGRVDDKV